MTSYKHYELQLLDRRTGEAIVDSGGTCKVTAMGGLAKATLYADKFGGALAQPFALNRGKVDFWVLDTLGNVDLFIDCPNGQFAVVKNSPAGALNEYDVDQGQRDQMMVIPFSIADFAAATEVDTGFDTLPALGRLFMPWAAIKVVAVDSGIVIDVGTDGSGANDPDGFLDGISLTTATIVPGTLTNGAATLGVLFSVQDSSNSGDLVPEWHFNATNENITATIATSGDTGTGYIMLPYQLMNIV